MAGLHRREAAARAIPSWWSPALYTAGDDDLDLLAAYAERGGHLVLGPRSGYADHEGRRARASGSRRA